MSFRYIAVDWGSTNLRAWLFQDEVCQDRRQSEAGVSRLNGKTPERALEEITEGWRTDDTPVLIAGMVGGAAGWNVAPYLPCPARLSDLSSRLSQGPLGVLVVPGLSIRQKDNLNVMRGEETQLLGARELCPSSLYVMPGTHSKWVLLDGDEVQEFRTLMTGELHHLLLSHSLIGANLPEQTQDPKVFQRGLQQGMEFETLLSRLFEVRAAHLLGALPHEEVSEFLSGLLIGSEIAGMIRHYLPSHETPIPLIGTSALTGRYQAALGTLGYEAQILDGEAAFQQGIRRIIHDMAKNLSPLDRNLARNPTPGG